MQEGNRLYDIFTLPPHAQAEIVEARFRNDLATSDQTAEALSKLIPKQLLLPEDKQAQKDPPRDGPVNNENKSKRKL